MFVEDCDAAPVYRLQGDTNHTSNTSLKQALIYTYTEMIWWIGYIVLLLL